MGAHILKFGGAASIAAVMLTAAPAAAVVVTRSYTVSANFIQQTAPVKSLTLDFTLTYDTQLTTVNQLVSSYSSSSNAPQFNNLPIYYATTYYSGFGTYLNVGGAASGSGYQEGADDFFVEFVVDELGNPLPVRNANVEYSYLGFRATYNTRLATVMLATPPPPPPGGTGPVPEPASWAMLITGFGLTGAAARGRRRVAA